MKVTVADGRYTVVMDDSGGLSALRYGEPWRDCVGDNLIYSLAMEVERLREENERLARERNEIAMELNNQQTLMDAWLMK